MLKKLVLNIKRPLKKYELIVLLDPDTSLEEQRTFFKKSRDIIQSFSGSLFHLDTWGKRRLTHSIGHFQIAIYFYALFEAQSECVFELERTMRIHDKVLRFMHTQLDLRISLAKHRANFRNVIDLSKQREQEKENRKQKRFATFSSYKNNNTSRNNNRALEGNNNNGPLPPPSLPNT